jgi:beta-phosphoglucomutase
MGRSGILSGMILGAIFDMDGVLVDSYHAHYESWRQLAADDRLSFSEEHFARTFGRTSRDIIRMTWPRPVSDEEVRAIDDRKEALFRDIIARAFPAMEGATALIHTLRAAGFRVAVGSSGPPENVELVLEHLGGRQLFDGVVHGMDVHRGKPDPEVFLLAAERAGVAPRASVVIEDAAPGIEAATRAGMASVALLSTGRSEADFHAVRPDLIVRSLRDLSPEVLGRLIEGQPLER